MFYPKLNPVISQYIVVIIANLSALGLGLGMSWASPVLVILMRKDDMVLNRPVTEEEGSWIVAAPLLIATFAMFMGILIDIIGRKHCITLGNIFNLTAGITCLFSTQVWMVILSRVFYGISFALLGISVPVYSVEVASKEIRGALCIIFQISFCLGTMMMLSIGPFITYNMINIIYVIVVFTTLIMILFLPESPYFLHSKGHVEETLNVLKLIRGCEESAKKEIEEYRILSEQNKIKKNINKKALYSDKVFLKALATCVVLNIIIQCIGFNSLTYYLQTILELTKTNIKSEIASAIFGFINLLAGVGTAFSADRFGRRPIMMAAFFGIGLGMIGMGTFFKLTESGDVTGFLNYLPLLSILVGCYCYSAGPGSLLFMIVAELFDGETRATGTSICYLISVFLLFLITKYFTYITYVLGVACSYWLFAVSSFLGVGFVMFFIPETKGKSISEIQNALRNGKSNDSVKYSCKNQMSRRTTSPT